MKTRLLTTAVLGIVAVGALAGCSSLEVTEDDASYEITDRVTRLAVNGDAGSVNLHTGDGPIQVKETYQYSSGRPRTEHRVEGDTLRLTDTGCGGNQVIFNKCETRYDIQVPAGTVVEVKLDAGAIRIKDLAGDLTAETDAGRIEGTGLRSGQALVKSDAGAIDLRFATAPTRTEARTDAGRVELHLPAGTSYAVDASTDAGKVDVNVERDPNSPHKVTARSDAGRVTVSTG
jgi:hypothetical protein